MQNITVSSIFLFVATFLVMFFKPSKITNHPSGGSTIVMFGDSLIVGVGASEGKDLASILSNKIKLPIINKGKRGETSAKGLERIEEIIELDPKVVMVLFGGNDYLRGVKTQETFNNIDTIISILQNFGAVVILLGIQGGIISDPYKKEFKKIAKRTGALYVSNVLDNVIGYEDYMSDDLHPNDKGYKMITDKIYPFLKKAL